MMSVLLRTLRYVQGLVKFAQVANAGAKACNAIRACCVGTVRMQVGATGCSEMEHDGRWPS